MAEFVGCRRGTRRTFLWVAIIAGAVPGPLLKHRGQARVARPKSARCYKHKKLCLRGPISSSHINLIFHFQPRRPSNRQTDRIAPSINQREELHFHSPPFHGSPFDRWLPFSGTESPTNIVPGRSCFLSLCDPAKIGRATPRGPAQFMA